MQIGNVNNILNPINIKIQNKSTDLQSPADSFQHASGNDESCDLEKQLAQLAARIDKGNEEFERINSTKEIPKSLLIGGAAIIAGTTVAGFTVGWSQTIACLVCCSAVAGFSWIAAATGMI